MSRSNDPHKQAHHPTTIGRCQVCTKPIRSGEDHVKVFHGGSYYLACCASCARKFEANPRAYVIV